MSNSLDSKTVKEILEGPDDELLHVVLILSKESRKRMNAKMADPEYRSKLSDGMQKIFASRNPAPKL